MRRRRERRRRRRTWSGSRPWSTRRACRRARTSSARSSGSCARVASRAAAGGRIDPEADFDRDAQLTDWTPRPSARSQRIVVLGRDTCEDTTRPRLQLDERGIAYDYYLVYREPSAYDW